MLLEHAGRKEVLFRYAIGGISRARVQV